MTHTERPPREKRSSPSLARIGRLLGRYLWPQWPRTALLGMLIVGDIALQLTRPQIVRGFIDEAGAGRPLSDLIRAGLLYLGVAVAAQATSMAAVYLSENVAWSSTNALRHDLALHCLHLDMSFHKAHTPGELLERIDGDVTTLANFFSRMTLHLISSTLLAAGILAMLFRESWQVGSLGLACALVTITVLRAVQRPAASAWGQSRQAEAALSGFLGERLQGTEDIRANGAESHVMEGLLSRMRDILHAWRRARLIQGLSEQAGASLYLWTRAGALALGAALFMRGEATIGTAYLIVSYVGQLQFPLDRLKQQASDFQQAGASIGRVLEILATHSRLATPSIAGTDPDPHLPAGPLSIAFDRVSFAYDDGTQDAESVLHDIDFRLEPGKVLGLLGRTGSGKTTLTRLLFRLYDPTAGSVRLNGCDLRSLQVGDLRRHVGLVTQDVELLSATIRDNLTLFNQRIPDARILEAFRTLGLWEWYQALPEGLDTVLQGGSSSLSAGEAQLLAFTRVLLKDASIVILDEASSRLDPATERLLERAVDRMLQGRTAIVIAHRLATVQRADEVIILEKGRAIEHGDRAALASDPASRFCSLLRTGMTEVLA